MNRNLKILFLILLLFFLINYKVFVYEYNNLFGTIHYNSGNYEKSVNFFGKNNDNYGKYNQANSFYKNGDFVSALYKYIDIQSEDINLNFKKYHNLGNTYYRLAQENNLDKELLLNSVYNYQNALEIKDDEKTRFNLEFVLDKLEEENENLEEKSGENENLDDKFSEETSSQSSSQGDGTENEKGNELENGDETFGDQPNNTFSEEATNEENNSNFSQEDLDFLKEYEKQLLENQVRYSEGFNKNYNERNDIFDNFFEGTFFDNSNLNQENKKNW